MQGVCALVCGELINIAVQRKLRTGDAVCVPADGGSEIAVVIEIFLRRIVAEDDIAQDTVSVGNDDALHRRTEIRYADTRSGGVFYRIERVCSKA